MKDYGSASHFQRVVLTMLAWHLDTADRKALAEIFLRIDKEKVGEISLKSLAEVLQKEFHLESAEIKRILENIDTNSNHTLDYTEFLAAMLKTRVSLHENLLKIGTLLFASKFSKRLRFSNNIFNLTHKILQFLQ